MLNQPIPTDPSTNTQHHDATEVPRLNMERGKETRNYFPLFIFTSCNHKRLGLYYLINALLFTLSGTLYSLLLRLELYIASCEEYILLL